MHSTELPETKIQACDIERICRQQIKFGSKLEYVFDELKNVMGKVEMLMGVENNKLYLGSFTIPVMF